VQPYIPIPKRWITKLYSVATSYTFSILFVFIQLRRYVFLSFTPVPYAYTIKLGMSIIFFHHIIHPILTTDKLSCSYVNNLIPNPDLYTCTPYFLYRNMPRNISLYRYHLLEVTPFVLKCPPPTAQSRFSCYHDFIIYIMQSYHYDHKANSHTTHIKIDMSFEDHSVTGATLVLRS